MAINLVSRYLQNSSPTERETFVRLLQGKTGQKWILSCTIQSILKAFEQEDLTKFLLKTLPYIPHDRLSITLIEKWATSEKAYSLLSKNIETVQIQNSIQSLKKYGILQEMSGKNEGFLYIDPSIYQEIIKHLPGKEKIIDPFFKFLSSNMKFDNTQDKYFEQNKYFRPYAEHLINSSEFKNNSEETIDFILNKINLLNNIANNYLQDNSFSQSIHTFQQSKKLCEDLGEIPDKEFQELSEEDQKKTLKILLKKDSKLADSLAKTLLNLGKIYFQMGEQTHAREYFDSAIKVREALRIVNNSPDFDWIVVRRVGEGWPLLESNHPEDWKKAEVLYLQLLNEGKGDSFNTYYCNLELSRIYYKLAQLTPPRQTHIKGDYYTKAINRLRDGGIENGIAFEGSLIVLSKEEKKEFRDALPETLLEIAKILSSRDNPSHDYRKAEEILFDLLEEQLKKLNPDKQKDYPFRIYHRLAMLYNAQVRSHLPNVDSERNAKLARRYAEKALQEMGFYHHKELVGFNIRRKKEIKELAEL